MTNPIQTPIKETPQASPPDFARLDARERRIAELYAPLMPNGPSDWDDWAWQIRHRIRTKPALARIIRLSTDEDIGIDGTGDRLTLSIPPVFAALMDPDDPACPVRMQCVPRGEELMTSPEEMRDPCGEENHSPVHGLVHRYPDRVLFLVTEMCAMYCRYCTRSRMVGDGQRTLSKATYSSAFDYIRSHPEIRDVLISGGDPLSLGDALLADILQEIKSIPHVEFVRIGTRIPATLPQRITPGLLAVFKKYSPLWMSIHFNHPREITPRARQACRAIADAGIPMGSQTVLLKGINDDLGVMTTLMHELLKIRVRPYYLYQCDPITGSRHFRTPVQTGLDLIRGLRGHTTGYAVPTFVIDAPGGGGKIPLYPDAVVSRSDSAIVLRNFQGQEFTYYEA